MLRAFDHPVATCWHVVCLLTFENGQIWANDTQHIAMRRNRAVKRLQHVTSNNVAICCVDMLRSFGWSLIPCGVSCNGLKCHVGERVQQLLIQPLHVTETYWDKPRPDGPLGSKADRLYPLRIRIYQRQNLSFSEHSDIISCPIEGSPLYLAPETITKQPIGREVDLWACAVICYTMLVCYLTPR